MMCMPAHMLTHLLAHSFTKHLLCQAGTSCTAVCVVYCTTWGYYSHRPQCEWCSPKLFSSVALLESVLYHGDKNMALAFPSFLLSQDRLLV